MELKMDRIKKIITSFFIAALMWLFLCVDMHDVYPNIYRQENAGTVVALVTFLQRVGAVFGDFSFLKELLFILSLFVSFKFSSKIKECAWIFKIVAVLLSGLYIFSESFKYTDSTAYITADVFMFVLSLLRGVGLYIIAVLAIYYAVFFLERIKPSSAPLKWSFLKVMLVLFVLWAPILISIYPGGYSIDVQIQLREFFGYESFTDAHPPFLTALEGLCVLLGNKLSIPTFGLFLFTLIQFSFVLLSLSYAIYEIIKMSGSNAFGWVAVLFAGLNTMVSFCVSYIGRDASYSAGLFVMAVAFLNYYRMLNSSFSTKECIKHITVFSIYSVLVSLMRHNGIYTVIVMVICIIAFTIKLIPLKKIKLLSSGILISSVIVYYLIIKAVYPSLGVASNKDSLLYVNMLQQTIRLDMEKPQAISDADREIIGKLIDTSKIADRYDPKTSDGIKFIIDLNADKKDIADYESVWFNEAIRHPFIFLASSYNIGYGFWAPVEENTINDFGSWYYESEFEELDFRIPYFFSSIRNICEILVSVWTRVPFVRLLHIPGIYTWLFIFALAYVLYRKKFIYLIPFIPGLLTVATFLIVPSFYGHPRYCFPIAYATMMYVSICMMHRLKEKDVDIIGDN